MKKEFQFQRLSLLFFLFFFFLFVVLGLQAIAVTDDYWLASYVVKNGRPFLSSIFWSLGQYTSWSGQFIVNFLQGVFTFSPLRTQYSSATHALLFFGATLLWAVYSYKKFEEDRVNRIVFAIAFFFVIFTFTFSVLGEAIFLGASSLIWSYLFFTIAYAVFSQGLFSKYTWLRYLLFFAVGNSSELLILPTALLFWSHRKDDDPPVKKYFSAFLFGLIMNLASPATVAHLRNGLSAMSFSPADQFYHMQTLLMQVMNLLGLKSLYILPLCFCYQASSSMNLEELKRALLENLSFAIASVLLLVPVGGPIADSFLFFFLIFFGLFIFWTIQFIKRKFLQVRTPLWLHHLAVLAYILVGIVIVSLNYLDAAKVRESFILQHIEIEVSSNKEKKLTVPNHRPPMNGHLLYYSDITNDKSDMNNLARVAYYGLESIVAK